MKSKQKTKLLKCKMCNTEYLPTFLMCKPAVLVYGANCKPCGLCCKQQSANCKSNFLCVVAKHRTLLIIPPSGNITKTRFAYRVESRLWMKCHLHGFVISMFTRAVKCCGHSVKLSSRGSKIPLKNSVSNINVKLTSLQPAASLVN